MQVKFKDFGLEIKEVDEQAGTFTGMLSVYNVVDLGRDLVEPGAFSKSIQERGGKVPMLWQHKTDEPIGMLEIISDAGAGLEVRGTFDLDVTRAREAYSLVKKQIITGLSIGYEAIKKKMVNGVRHLTEIKLYEGSVVTFPMLPLAQIGDVKSGVKSDFNTELQNAQTWAARYMMLDALDQALFSHLYEENERDNIIEMSSDSIDQFKSAYTDLLPKLLDLRGMKSEVKKGARHSSATRTQIEEAISKLQALLDGEAANTSEGSPEAAGTSAPEAARKSNEPDALHSALNDSYNAWESKLSDLLKRAA